MNRNKKPWQYDWKQPQWRSLSTASSTGDEFKILDHAAALLRPSEVRPYHSNESSDINSTFVLTVKLFQSMSTNQRNDHHRADELSFEITRHDSWTTTNSIVMCRRFQWPILHEEEKKDVKSSPLSWFLRNDSRNKEGNTRNKNSMIAVCLCRLPQQPASYEEALHVLNELALQQRSLVELPSIELPSDKSSSNNNNNTRNTELMLICLASNGTVYMYDPWTLLQPTSNLSSSQGRTHQDSTDLMEHSMISLWLGESLFQTFQQSIFPLSRPARTLSPTPIPTSPSEWNIVLDPASRPFLRTNSSHQYNAKNCVTMGTILCVFGQCNPTNGFVTFWSLRTYSEVRTVILPFVPLRLVPLGGWKQMEWIWVFGTQQSVLIRTDVPTTTTTTTTMVVTKDQHEESSHIIQPFQILPVEIPTYHNSNDDKSFQIIGWSSAESTENPIVALCSWQGNTIQIWTRTLMGIRKATTIDPLYERYGHISEPATMMVVTTHETRASFTEFQLDSEPTSIPWFHMGSGWILVGGSMGVYMVSLAGATTDEGGYVQQLSKDPCPDNERVSDIVLFHPLEKQHEQQDHQRIKLPLVTDHFSGLQKDDEIEKIGLLEHEGTLNDDVIEGIRNISNSEPTDINHAQEQDECTRQSWSITTTEQTSRTAHNESDRISTSSHFDQQLPCISVGSRYMISFRKRSILPGVPFQSVLWWLSTQGDYFTAASLALSLLKDVRTLRHLWQCFEMTDSDDDVSMLEGLLDGIQPLKYDDLKKGDESYPISNTLSQLADMTIGCLIKGGRSMSSTLVLFLATNNIYDPSRVSLMLTATISRVCSTWTGSVNDENTENSDNENVLWPVRALLEVGNARDCLWTVMLLLNATIPNELRCRRYDDTNVAPQDVQLCQALVHQIITTSDEATQMLFHLVDESSQTFFWESLDDATKQMLALIEVTGKGFPMLRQAPVRSWLISFLLSVIEESSVSAISMEWLKQLTMCCLRNARCPLVSSMSVESEQSVAKEKEEENQQHEEELIKGQDVLKRYKDQVHHLRNVVIPAPGSGGMDYDLVIPSLLILEKNDVTMVPPLSSYSTQSILNAVCYHAGRKQTTASSSSSSSLLFTINATILMRECFLAENVLAAAHLIGGKDGLVLHCCHVLRTEDPMLSMTDAEQFLMTSLSTLHTDTIVPQQEASEESISFELTESHCTLLFLLDEHVLSIRKYGDFNPTHCRDKVDPAFAASIILRTWWRITSSSSSSSSSCLTLSSEWLMEWLQDALYLQKRDQQYHSPLRLACAAFIRALLWPDNNDTNNHSYYEDDDDDKEDDDDNRTTISTTLATRLCISNDFLVQLTSSCCGLVEALPEYVMEQGWKQQQQQQHDAWYSSTPKMKSRTRQRTNKTTTTTTDNRRSYSPHSIRSDGMDDDDSFQSAVSSLDM